MLPELPDERTKISVEVRILVWPTQADALQKSAIIQRPVSL